MCAMTVVTIAAVVSQHHITALSAVPVKTPVNTKLPTGPLPLSTRNPTPQPTPAPRWVTTIGWNCRCKYGPSHQYVDKSGSFRFSDLATAKSTCLELGSNKCAGFVAISKDERNNNFGAVVFQLCDQDCIAASTRGRDGTAKEAMPLFPGSVGGARKERDASLPLPRTLPPTPRRRPQKLFSFV